MISRVRALRTANARDAGGMGRLGSIGFAEGETSRVAMASWMPFGGGRLNGLREVSTRAY